MWVECSDIVSVEAQCMPWSSGRTYILSHSLSVILSFYRFRQIQRVKTKGENARSTLCKNVFL
jgi:hypothetical protein